MEKDIRSLSQLIRKIELFEGLGEVALAHLAEAFETVKFAQGSELLTAQSPVPGLIVILEGTAGIMVSGEIVAERRAGDALGEMGALLDEPASATVRAQTEIKALQIPSKRFKELVPRSALLKLLKTTGERRLELGLRLSEALQHTPQGLVKINTKGQITADISSMCLTYLGASNVYDLRFKDFGQVMERLCPGFTQDWDSFPLIFDQNHDESQRSMIMSILPQEVQLTLKGRIHHIALSYYTCLNRDGEVDGIDIGMSDVTSQKLLAQVQSEEQKRQKLYADPEGFVSLLELCSLVTDGLKNPVNNTLKADLHTLKGVSGLFDLIDLSQICHLLEDQLRTGEVSRETEADFLALVSNIQGYFKEMPPELRALFEGVTISQNDFHKIQVAFEEEVPDLARRLFIRATSRPASGLAERYAKEVAKLALELGKQVEFIDHCAEARIPRFMLSRLNSLIHLVRNAVDHGIESPSERQQRGKSPMGHLEFSVNVSDKLLELEFKDDGRGIDPDRVLKKAQAIGLIGDNPTLSLEEIYALIFHPGFSTRDEVSQTSGRGEGMAALHQDVAALSGVIEIQSQVGKGTRFILKIPSPI